MRKAIAVFALTLGVTACSKKEAELPIDTAAVASVEPTDTAVQAISLYDRLGGKAAVSSVVDSLVAVVTSDARINKKFAKADVARLKQKLFEQICATANGGCQYTGRPMVEAHRGMGVTNAQFDAFLEDLSLALKENNVERSASDALVDDLRPARQDIVERK